MLKNKSYSFVIRIWMEQREALGEQAILRGVIEYVVGEEKISFKDFDEMIAFIRRIVTLNINKKEAK